MKIIDVPLDSTFLLSLLTEAKQQNLILRTVEEAEEQKVDNRGNMPTLKAIARSGEEGTLTFDDNNNMDVDAMTAKAIVSLYSKVNPVNQHKIEHMVNVDRHNFAKVAAFAHGAHSLGK